MIWDDAVQQDHAISPLLPKNVVIVTFHYGVEKTYKPYIDTVANAGFDQMVAPGAANWNEIYPDLGTAYANVGRFVGEAKDAPRMLGMFMTVWHDDGETLYEATWPAVAYAAATRVASASRSTTRRGTARLRARSSAATIPGSQAISTRCKRFRR